MPVEAPLSKVEGCGALGAIVHRGGTGVEECVAAARARAQEAGMAFVHPFDDPDVVAGQGTLGLELLDDVPDLAKVVVPVGGGGLASGIAIAVKSARPGDRGRRRAGRHRRLLPRVAAPRRARRGAAGADDRRRHRGQAPGRADPRLVQRWLDGVVVVAEDEVAEAMVLLMEKAKLVVEGAGAVGVAALLGGRRRRTHGTTVVVLSGGNVFDQGPAGLDRAPP